MNNPKTCYHHRKVGDNYGTSCMDCGAQLAGYGNNAEFVACFHDWMPDESDPGLEYCMYCQSERRKS